MAQAPEMVFLEDTDGDDKMDKRTVLFGGFGTWDTHAGPSNLRYGLDNHIWGAVGYSGFEYEFEDGLVNFSMGVYKFDRQGQYLEPVGKFKVICGFELLLFFLNILFFLFVVKNKWLDCPMDSEVPRNKIPFGFKL